MKSLMLFVGLVFSTLVANAQTPVPSMDLRSCKETGNPNKYVLKVCSGILGGNDRVTIQGVPERTELVISDASQPNNHYYTPLGMANANYHVVGPIHIVSGTNFFGKKGPSALIYRLNYTPYSGRSGYKIITVRIGKKPNKRKNTCIVASFDDSTATMFANIPEEKRETAMRQAAANAVGKNDFQKRGCMKFEHNHEIREAATSGPADPDEGDNLETAKP